MENTIWVKFLRENVHLRESFFKFLDEYKADLNTEWPNATTIDQVWRLQGGVRSIDFITKFVSRELESLEQNNARRTDPDPKAGRKTRRK